MNGQLKNYTWLKEKSIILYCGFFCIWIIWMDVFLCCLWTFYSIKRGRREFIEMFKKFKKFISTNQYWVKEMIHCNIHTKTSFFLIHLSTVKRFGKRLHYSTSLSWCDMRQWFMRIQDLCKSPLLQIYSNLCPSRKKSHLIFVPNDRPFNSTKSVNPVGVWEQLYLLVCSLLPYQEGCRGCTLEPCCFGFPQQQQWIQVRRIIKRIVPVG